MLDDLIQKVKNHLINYKTLKDFNLDFDNINLDFSKYPFNDDKYLKYLLYRNDDFEIFVYTWGKKSKTPLHNHPSRGCRLFVLSGELMEERIFNDKTKKITTFKKGDSSYMHDSIGMHQVTTLKEAITIHIYSPPNFFD